MVFSAFILQSFLGFAAEQVVDKRPITMINDDFPLQVLRQDQIVSVYVSRFNCNYIYCLWFSVLSSDLSFFDRNNLDDSYQKWFRLSLLFPCQPLLLPIEFSISKRICKSNLLNCPVLWIYCHFRRIKKLLWYIAGLRSNWMYFMLELFPLTSICTSDSLISSKIPTSRTCQSRSPYLSLILAYASL